VEVDIFKTFKMIVEYAPTISYCIVILATLVGGVFVIRNWIMEKINARKINARKLEELKQASPDKAKGIIFGKLKGKVIYSPVESEGSVGVFSASGTGKTSAVGIPTMRSWTGTSFTIDISGDICKNCPDMPHKLIYEPENPDTVAFNIFGGIDDLKAPDDKNEALAQLALLLMPKRAKNDNAKFFEENGRNILTASLIAFYWAKMDFVEICEKIVGSGWKDLFRSIDETENEKAMQYINSFEETSEQNTAGCKQACDDALKLFATNAKVKKSIHRPTREEITIQPKMIEDHNIFVVVDDPKLDLYSPLLNIITSQQMQYISNRELSNGSKNILLFLDEYASLRLTADTIIEALRKYRKRKCRVMMMTQNLSDLDILYGKETTRAIMANLRFKVLLGGLGETESQKYFAELIGYKKTTRHSESSNVNTTTYTQSEAKEYEIEPAELDRQGKDTVILIHPEGYMLLKKNYYFKSKK